MEINKLDKDTLNKLPFHRLKAYRTALQKRFHKAFKHWICECCGEYEWDIDKKNETTKRAKSEYEEAHVYVKKVNWIFHQRKQQLELPLHHEIPVGHK